MNATLNLASAISTIDIPGICVLGIWVGVGLLFIALILLIAKTLGPK